ncbi:hypothetical protein FR932_17900 [Moritella marina ATCC 15381]|uniref:ATPase RavA stimulator ViaA n=1 Tax=Moritella marina ATCC 15381 TaxID=1202962 RepID=A0A5J6WQR5_MORMI|nr:hypothetical protein [Moritella marina]QFI39558.1 hypothetical protein FR932_17900 [Moritella marina ATCC 15381]
MAHPYNNSSVTMAMRQLVDEAVLDITAHDRVTSDIKSAYINDWKLQVTSLLADMPLPPGLSNEIHLCETARLLSPINFRNKVEGILCKVKVDSSFYDTGLTIYQQNRTMSDDVFFAVFLDSWQQAIELQLYQLQSVLIEEQREQLLIELAEREETIEQLEDVLDNDLLCNGERLWDLAKGKLTHLDTQLLQRYATNLRKNKEVKQIASELGRMALAHINPEETPNSYETWVLDNSYQDNVPDDMQGVTYSDEISRMLQTEAVNLTFPELEIIFYKRYLERHLLTYQYQGALQQYKKVTQYRDITDADEQTGGPFIICVDSSTSMQGFPELTAKSICYALLQVAFQQDRQCYLMIFSNEVVTFPVTKSTSLSTMLTFLSSSFRGGTNLQPVIEKSLELMSSAQYKNADTLVISDFIAQKLPTHVADKVRAIKTKQNRYHAISLSSQGNPELMKIFDHVWRYSAGLTGRLKKVK